MKKTLLYVSPFWPQKSGISEYSEALVWGLKEYFDVTILTKKKLSNREIVQEFKINIYNEKENYSAYDYIIYNFGNSPENHDYMYDMLTKYPGHVILHDYTLYYLTIDHYRKKGLLFQKMYELEGAKGVIKIKDQIRETGEFELFSFKNLPPELPLNTEVLSGAKGVFAHSEYILNLIKLQFPEKVTFKIELVDCMPKIKLNEEDFLRKKYGIGKDEFIVGAVGMIAPSKQNEIACRAIKKYNKNGKKKIRYVMIGEGDCVDSYLGRNIIKTGFLQNRDFFDAINSCDLILNMRNPYNGESSATLMQCMIMKKQCVVTDVGWFGELDEECVIKVPLDVTDEELLEVILKCMENGTDNIKGYEYVSRYCNAQKISEKIYCALCEGREA